MGVVAPFELEVRRAVGTIRRASKRPLKPASAEDVAALESRLVLPAEV